MRQVKKATEAEIADFLGWDMKELRKKKFYIECFYIESLFKQVLDNDDSKTMIIDTIEDRRVKSSDDEVDFEVQKSVLHSEMEKLGKKDKKIIQLYFFEDVTLKKIGEELELTESRISQLLKSIKLLLKDNKILERIYAG